MIVESVQESKKQGTNNIHPSVSGLDRMSYLSEMPRPIDMQECTLDSCSGRGGCNRPMRVTVVRDYRGMRSTPTISILFPAAARLILIFRSSMV